MRKLSVIRTPDQPSAPFHHHRRGPMGGYWHSIYLFVFGRRNRDLPLACQTHRFTCQRGLHCDRGSINNRCPAVSAQSCGPDVRYQASKSETMKQRIILQRASPPSLPAGVRSNSNSCGRPRQRQRGSLHRSSASNAALRRRSRQATHLAIPPATCQTAKWASPIALARSPSGFVGYAGARPQGRRPCEVSFGRYVALWKVLATTLQPGEQDAVAAALLAHMQRHRVLIASSDGPRAHKRASHRGKALLNRRVLEAEARREHHDNQGCGSSKRRLRATSGPTRSDRRRWKARAAALVQEQENRAREDAMRWKQSRIRALRRLHGVHHGGEGREAAEFTGHAQGAKAVPLSVRHLRQQSAGSYGSELRSVRSDRSGLTISDGQIDAMLNWAATLDDR